MPDLASLLLAASALVIFSLGCMHLWLTFRGNKLHPRDAALKIRMKEVSPVLTRQTTLWKAWIGFNASHSHGAMLFGLIYGYLALAAPDVFPASWFLQAVGLAFLAGYLFLGWRYWFSVPFRGIIASSVLYVGALVVHWI